jgi:hypothetical protein
MQMKNSKEWKINRTVTFIPLIIILVILSSYSSLQAKDIQPLNPDFFGQPTSKAVKFLYDKKSDEIEPYLIKTDIRIGKYYAASVYYSTSEITFAEVRKSINKLYGSYEKADLLIKNKMAIWRVTNKEFSIQLTREQDYIRISYIHYKSLKDQKEYFKALKDKNEGGKSPLKENPGDTTLN